MRVSRISRPGALYGASASAKTFETIDEEFANPIDFEEVSDVNIPNVIHTESYLHMPGFVGPNRKFPKDSNLVNSVKKYKGRQVENPF